MKKTFYLIFLVLSIFALNKALLNPSKLNAATLQDAVINTDAGYVTEIINTTEATEEATASDSSKLASPSAEVVEKIQEKNS